jgi:hypothetical protein
MCLTSGTVTGFHPRSLGLVTAEYRHLILLSNVLLAIPGVVDAVSGYTGGSRRAPTYGQVCSGRTGPAEAVLATYDPAVVLYEYLLEEFWRHHDATTPNRQGPDVGPSTAPPCSSTTPSRNARPTNR